MYRLLLLFIIFIFGCEPKKNLDLELQQFTNLFQGTFTSEEQAKNQSGYQDITLKNIQIWKEAKGYWVYQELYLSNDPTKVYTQRVIEIKKSDSNSIMTTNYVITNQETYKNGWKNPSIFEQLTINHLKIKLGCNLYFKKKTSSIYHGKTDIGTCMSTIRENITYITSTIIIANDKITSWDRGYDSESKQVWGKIQEPYKYKRVKE